MKKTPLTLTAGGMLLLPFLACAQQERPNVILVMTDDQGYGDLGLNGNRIIQTPNIDGFAQDGIRFTNYHVGTTSAPTRAGLMTGRNCNRNGVWHTTGGCSILNKDEVTIADVFSAAGYSTGMFGKWHLGDSPDYSPENRGFDEAVCLRGGGISQTPGYWDNDYMDDVYYHNGEPQRYKGYCTDVFFEEAIRFMRENRKAPFFCYISLNAPHGPFNVPEKYYDLYKEEDSLLPDQKRFYGMITNIDENFGKVEEFLEEYGLAENTILIFTTDNGTAMGWKLNKKTGKFHGFNAGMQGTKSSQYDGGHRVPFIMRWPAGDYDGGKDYAGLAAHVDVLPTLAAMAGIDYDPVKALDGMDISSYVKKDQEADRMLVTDTQRIQWPEKGRKSCVMKSTWRLVDGQELYNVRHDVGQKRNLIKKYPKLAAEMQAFYDQWWEEVARESKYSPIDIHADRINHLTCHDIHHETVSWNQMKIRKGELSGVGHYSLEVMEAGTYLVQLRRWPSVSGLALGDAVDGTHHNNPWWTDLAEGKAMKFRKAYVLVNGKRYEAEVDNEATCAEFELVLPGGQVDLTAVLVLEDGQETSAFYVDLKKKKDEVSPSPAARVAKTMAALRSGKSDEVLVVAHRGDWRNYPQNSIAAIESAVEMGADIVEIDVQRTNDGKLILMHDATLDRATTGKGKVSTVGYEYVQGLFLRNGCNVKTLHKVPTLEEALLAAKGKVVLNIDKGDRFFDEIFALLEKTGTTDQVIMKGKRPAKEVKQAFGKYLDEVFYMPRVELDKEGAIERLQEYLDVLDSKAFSLSFADDKCPARIAAKALLQDKAIIWYNSLWASQNGGHDDDAALEDAEDGWGWLIDVAGAGMIQTDRPEMLLKYLRNKNLHD